MNIHLKLNVEAYSRWLFVTFCLLVLMHLGLNYYNYHVSETPWLILQLFELDEENNLPTWFSSYLLLNNAIVLWVIAGSCSDKYRFHWMVLAVGFLVLSIDEVAGLHETFNTAIDTNWAIFGGLIVLILGVSYLRFLWSLPRRLTFLFILSGSIFIGGAIGVELLSEDLDEETMTYAYATAVEEGMEMLGALMFLITNLKEMKNSEKS
ncbi:MAG: hypothetical protein ACI9FB_002533 [Candidatus Azotimanducaceae bacterium]|jgi:hypothetical protein